MNWVEEWAKLNVIAIWIIVGIISLIALVFVVWFVIRFITQTYKKHSKKYVWNTWLNDYVKKEDFYK